MKRLSLFGLLLPLVAARPQDAPAGKFRIERVRVQESRYAERQIPPSIVEGQSLAIRITLAGLTKKDEGLSFAFDLRLTNAEGKHMVDEKEVSQGTVEDQFDCGSFTTSLFLGDPRGDPGKYTLSVTARDRNAGLSATWSTELELKKAEFGIYNPYFSADEDGRYEIPAGLTLGGQRFVQYRVLGFAAQGDRLHLADGFEIYDEKMTLLYRQPVSANGVRARVPKNWIVPASRKINCVKAGSYVFRLIVVDKLSDKQVTRDVPFRVLADAGSEH